MKKQPPSVGFSMFVDEETFDALRGMMNLYQDYALPRIPDNIKETDEYMDGEEMLIDFFDTLYLHAHEMHWCKDPDCTFNEDNNIK